MYYFSHNLITKKQRANRIVITTSVDSMVAKRCIALYIPSTNNSVSRFYLSTVAPPFE